MSTKFLSAVGGLALLGALIAPGQAAAVTGLPTSTVNADVGVKVDGLQISYGGTSAANTKGSFTGAHGDRIDWNLSSSMGAAPSLRGSATLFDTSTSAADSNLTLGLHSTMSYGFTITGPGDFVDVQVDSAGGLTSTFTDFDVDAPDRALAAFGVQEVSDLGTTNVVSNDAFYFTFPDSGQITTRTSDADGSTDLTSPLSSGVNIGWSESHVYRFKTNTLYLVSLNLLLEDFMTGPSGGKQTISGFIDPTFQVLSAPGQHQISFSDGVLAAAPEPASWALMILGFGAAGGVLRRRRTSALRAAAAA